MVGLGFEETKLRLGLPGGGKVEADEEAGATARSSRKRGFAETIDLKLNPEPASAAAPTAGDEEVADGVAGAGVGQMKRSPSQSSVVTTDPERPRAPKAHRSSFRKNILAVQAALVKVSVDGAPYLRKMDMCACRSCGELSKALEKMFGSFTMASAGREGREQAG